MAVIIDYCYFILLSFCTYNFHFVNITLVKIFFNWKKVSLISLHSKYSFVKENVSIQNYFLILLQMLELIIITEAEKVPNLLISGFLTKWAKLIFKLLPRCKNSIHITVKLIKFNSHNIKINNSKIMETLKVKCCSVKLMI